MTSHVIQSHILSKQEIRLAIILLKVEFTGMMSTVDVQRADETFTTEGTEKKRRIMKRHVSHVCEQMKDTCIV